MNIAAPNSWDAPEFSGHQRQTVPPLKLTARKSGTGSSSGAALPPTAPVYPQNELIVMCEKGGALGQYYRGHDRYSVHMCTDFVVYQALLTRSRQQSSSRGMSYPTVIVIFGKCTSSALKLQQRPC